MRNILFLTSSRVKLQHARYLCRDYDIQIVEKSNYGAAYSEPRTSNREELLVESIEDAKKRLLKQKIVKDLNQVDTPLIDETFISQEIPLILNKLFFLEDTSVRIHSLSTDIEEFPGTDIKYWMKTVDFCGVDQMLKNKGNNRSVTVRSDIVLYLPKHLRESKDQEYLHFSSQQNGTVTEKEYIFNTNELCPWLDNQTFNKWFVPTGCSVPISMLSEQKASQYDFRAGAFRNMLDFLEKANFITKRVKKPTHATQEILSLFDTPAFLVCGLPCAGKTILGEYMSANHGYYHIEASDFMYLSFHKTHGARTSVKISDFAEKVLVNSPSIVVDQILKHLREIDDVPFIITGFRSPVEIETFMNRYRGFNTIHQVYVKAHARIRYDRSIRRDRKGDGISSIRDFLDRDKQQLRMGLKEIRKNLKNGTIVNNSSFDDYYQTFSHKHPQLFNTEVRSAFIDVPQERPADLEEAILLALVNVDEYLTTTEIAHRVNSVFKRSKLETSKNNVSRYFNKSFYPYYDIFIDENGKLRYCLSPTGRSRAQFLLQKNNKNS